MTASPLAFAAGLALGAAIAGTWFAVRRRRDRRRHLEAVRTLMDLVDAADVFTRGHSGRICRLAFRLGRRLQLSDGALEELQYAALLHDVGRTAIRRDVLARAGPLTDRERDQVRTHPTIGHDLIRPFGFYAGAAALILAHHEQPDGKGYPRGVAGEDIPTGARILMVAAAYDALTIDRPYRRGLSADDALAEIRRHAGTQFDATVVEALEGLHAEGRLAGARAGAAPDESPAAAAAGRVRRAG
jgi:HD-GYP domain-containing protein (c-di-GMP phosphodiesterase class II)